MQRKIYYCRICKKRLDYRPIRLVKQLHDNKETYGMYHMVENYDFCYKCYEKFDNWLKKH